MAQGSPEQVVSRSSRWAALVLAPLLLVDAARPSSAALDGLVQGVWMVEEDVAIAVTHCGNGSLCGRIAWLRVPHDDTGRPKRDANNLDLALRDRPLCGMTVLHGLLPVPGEPGRWASSSFYNPRDGRSYGLTASLRSADVLVARIYVGVPFLGRNQTLLRIQRPHGGGWC